MQHQRGGGRSRRRGLWAGAGAAAVVVIAVVVAVVTSGDDEPSAVEPEVVVLPSPTATETPIELPEATAFLAAMPGTTLQYALTAAEEHEGLRAAGALESWRLVYSDGQGGEVIVHAGQWRDAESAAAVMADVLALDAQDQAGADPTDAPAGTASPTEVPGTATPTGTGSEPEPEPDADAPQPPMSGDVLVDGAATGTFHIRAGGQGEDAASEDVATATWTNGTAFFQAAGPLVDLPNFYAAFPL